MGTRLAVLSGLLVLLLGLAGCGADGGSSAQGPLSVEQALSSSPEEPVTVTGFVVAPEGGPVRLCSALLESYPPQCGEPSLVVEGLDLDTVAGLSRTNDPSLAQVVWSDATVPVFGELADGVLTVSAG